MKELCKAANLSQFYTNHCNRSTAITLWSNAGLPNRHNMTLSGHSNITSRATMLHHLRSSSRCAVGLSHLLWIHKPHKPISKCKSSVGTSSNLNNLDQPLVVWFQTTEQNLAIQLLNHLLGLPKRASDIHLEVLTWIVHRLNFSSVFTTLQAFLPKI